MKFTRWLKKRVMAPAGPTPVTAHTHRAQGDAARAVRDWAAAAAAYEAAFNLDPDDAQIGVQWGHALKEDGRPDEAALAYQRATQADRTLADPPFQLGVLLSQIGRSDEAIEAYAEAMRRDPSFEAARAALVTAGRRDLIPGNAVGSSASQTTLARLEGQLSRLKETLAALAEVSTYSIQNYDAFRRAFPTPSPPRSEPAGSILVRIDGSGCEPDALRRTLTTLLDQRFQDWRASVVLDPAIAEHPVASLMQTDDRFQNASAGSPLRDQAAFWGILPLGAGIALDPQALGWLAFAMKRTGADAVICDHDSYTADWRRGLVRSQPVLNGLFDRLDFELGGWPDALALFRAFDDPVLDIGRVKGAVVHVPLPLVSLELTPAPADPAPRPGLGFAGAEPILVVIPTHDQPELLRAFVETLRSLAVRPEALRIRLMNNRGSVETVQVLSALDLLEGVEVVDAAEPFNWSRINNLGARLSDEPLIVFANDDMLMLTQGWDDRLRHWLSRSEVGAVGARLLYPDGTVQHAGIVLGIDERPIHEGRHAATEDGGPSERWRRTRPVAAVTGAFLACRRDTFEAAEGFNERLAVAYNDIDFCLRVREQGARVLYAADIELTHFESKTRGLNDAAARIAWDDAELADARSYWGEWLSHDPSYNPHWASGPNRAFDGFRPVSTSEVLTHLDMGLPADPWVVDRERGPKT